jgi:hypothetical protein
MVRAAWLDGQVGRGSRGVLGRAPIAIETDQAINFLAVLGPGDPRAQPRDDPGDLVARNCRPALRPRQFPGREPDGMHLDKHLARSWIRDRDLLVHDRAGRPKRTHRMHADYFPHSRASRLSLASRSG